MEPAQGPHMKADTKDICAVIRESDYSACHRYFSGMVEGTGVTMEMLLPKTQILNKTPKPRNIKETKRPSLPAETPALP